MDREDYLDEGLNPKEFRETLDFLKNKDREELQKFREKLRRRLEKRDPVKTSDNSPAVSMR